jgi:hypothetical protein
MIKFAIYGFIWFQIFKATGKIKPAEAKTLKGEHPLASYNE